MAAVDTTALITAVADAIIAHADELTDLDRAIGDGDHGSNMKRGCEAVLADLDTIASKPFGEAITAAGMQLVMKVGGASGPLYGTLFMTLGKSLQEPFDQAAFAIAFRTAVDAVMARGKSEPGQKTMLEVLVAVRDALENGKSIAEIQTVADEAAKGTIPMKALKGRASFMGDRSIGHMDPGARSSQIMVDAICEAIA